MTTYREYAIQPDTTSGDRYALEYEIDGNGSCIRLVAACGPLSDSDLEAITPTTMTDLDFLPVDEMWEIVPEFGFPVEIEC